MKSPEKPQITQMNADRFSLQKDFSVYQRLSALCRDSVEWIVMAAKRQISPEQVAAMVSRLHDNNRPVQPLGNRKIGQVSR